MNLYLLLMWSLTIIFTVYFKERIMYILIVALCSLFLIYQSLAYCYIIQTPCISIFGEKVLIVYSLHCLVCNWGIVFGGLGVIVCFFSFLASKNKNDSVRSTLVSIPFVLLYVVFCIVSIL